jgi:hypothetical protein
MLLVEVVVRVKEPPKVMLTLTTAVLIQKPPELVPKTVYVVLAVGELTTTRGTLEEATEIVPAVEETIV